MGNYVIALGNYMIATPSQLGNYKIADTVIRNPGRPGKRLVSVPLGEIS
jgi:hypothetical protein